MSTLKYRKIKLVGGSRDGDLAEVFSRQWCVVLPSRTTQAERDALRIDELMSYKHPEDLYRLVNGEYVFEKTFNYK